MTSTSNDNRVVISGMSGLYPRARHVKDFSDILYNKVDPITTENHRWNYKHPELSEYIGMVPELNRFDSQFFKVSHRNGYTMDVMTRKLLEQVYQAIYDAGLSPEHLSGKKIGVYVGSCFSETEKVCSYEDKVGTGTIGCYKSFFANQISYWLNIKGPSYAVDQSCCSSIAVLENACRAIERGECEAAIVGAGSVCLHPQTMIHFSRIINISPTGKTKSFAQDADGCVKSEAINALFLQKADDALRIYADVVHIKSIFTEIVAGKNGQKYGFYRDSALMAKYLKEFYTEANVTPNSVEYIEAFGAGTSETDKAELDAFDTVFCGDRTEPLIVGNVMSNIGYTEAASGIASITKVLLGYQKGKIAANLNCENRRQDIPALNDNRMVIATDHHPIQRSYIAINNLSYNGVNSHVLLHGHFKPKSLNLYQSSLPRLVTISGRHDNAVKRIFDDLKSRPIDPEELALLNHIHEKKINSHLRRGYAIFGTSSDDKTVTLSETVEYFDDIRRPLWFVYSGMGSQWCQMGLHLMRIPIFAATVKRCHDILSPYGVDLINILISEDKSILENSFHACIGITAIQIGLTAVLQELGIVANNIIGHSIGEVACAYADGAFTLEEAMLTSYARGKVSVEIPVEKGCMYAIGLGYQQIKNVCPNDIFVACHNGPDSCTLAGLEESMKIFISSLTSQGIFAKEVHSCNIAFHSKYVEKMGAPLFEHLKKVIKNPVERSQRWISTSVAQDKWHDDIAKYSSPEYFTNNMMNPVLFEEALKFVPPNAVLVEIAPFGILQAILKRSLPFDCRHIPLTRRGQENNVMHFLRALGSLYTAGYNPQIGKLYPKVEFPVSTETPSLSHLVEWVHDEQWDLPLYMSGEKRMAASTRNLITLHDDEFKYLRGNIVNGRVVYPFAAALVAVWDTLALFRGLKRKTLSVQFRDIHLYAQPILQDQRQLKLNVFLHRGTGKFEVSEDFSKIATGYITENLKDVPRMKFDSTEPLNLESHVIYELLHEKNYTYRDEFRTIYKANASFTEAQLLWANNWVTLIDGMLQLNALKDGHNTVSQPTYITRVCIDIDCHKDNIYTSGDKEVVTANISKVHNLTRCGGVLIDNVKFYKLPFIVQDHVTIKSTIADYYKPNITNDVLGEDDLIPRSVSTPGTEYVILHSDHLGDLKSLKWLKASEPMEPGIVIDVHFAGLNDSDVKKATGVIPFDEDQDFIYGMDYSGKLASGARVMGLVTNGAIATKVVALPELLWDVPQQWSLEDAATVPLAYSIAFYCLKIKADVARGMTVLILGGEGALGQAAISIALAYNCKVFTTVNDQIKKQSLLTLFPGLNEKNIGYSGDNLFRKTVLRGTSGKGCDVVIKCGAGEIKNVSLACCARFGITIDIVQALNKEMYNFDYRYLTKQRSYIAVDLFSIFDHEEDMKRIKELITEGIQQGYVQPLTHVTYEANDVVSAFKFLQSTQRSERVLLRLHDSQLEADSRFTCLVNVWQIICFDDIIGIQFTEKLINNGARKLLLNCTSPSSYLQIKLRYWSTLGVEVKIFAKDLTEPNAVEAMLKSVASDGYVEGIFMFIMTENKELERSIAKLDYMTRKLCPSIKNFVVSSTNKSIEQSSRQVYESRIQDQLPITVIYLPPLQEVAIKQTERTISRKAAINAICKTIVDSTADVEIRVAENRFVPLIQKIASIADVEISKDIPISATLRNCGIGDDKTQAIKAYLRTMYNTYIETDDILSLTLKRIHDIERNCNECDFENLKELEIFYSHIDSDEVLASTPIVVMKTRANYTCKNEIDMDITSLYIIPGLEGHHSRFRLMCERLKLPTFTLQPGYANPEESIKDMAERYAQILLQKMKVKNNFYLLGYETGVLLALETAKILERNGRKGTIFCVGQTPEELKITIEDIMESLHKDGIELDDAVAKHMVNLIKGHKKTFLKIENEIKGARSWPEKVNICVEELVGHNGHTSQYLRDIINAALGRIIQFNVYEFQPFQLESKIVLLHSTSKCNSMTMQGFSKQTVVHEIDTPLGTITQDLRCASIINANLSQDVLDFFEQNSLCETYFYNGNTFSFVPCPE